jgi:hypothetical protein
MSLQWNKPVEIGHSLHERTASYDYTSKCGRFRIRKERRDRPVKTVYVLSRKNQEGRYEHVKTGYVFVRNAEGKYVPVISQASPFPRYEFDTLEKAKKMADREAAREERSGGGGAKARASRGAVARFVDPHEPPGLRASFNRWFGKKYGLSPVELDALYRCHRIDRLEQELDAWRQAHGWLATNSPLARGKLMELVRSGEFT